MQNEQMASTFKGVPQINSRSKRLLGKTPRTEAVHDRLHLERSSSALGRMKSREPARDGSTFRPNIQKKSQALKRPLPVSDILYQDAKLRKARNQERSQARQTQEDQKLKYEVPKLAGSEKYVVAKFTKELV